MNRNDRAHRGIPDAADAPALPGRPAPTTAASPLGARIARALYRRLAPQGFDLVQYLSIGWYNRAVDADYRVPDFGDPDRLAVVIGNTRALWPALATALARDPALAADADPVDRYAASAIPAAMAELTGRDEVDENGNAAPATATPDLAVFGPELAANRQQAPAWLIRYAHDVPPRRVAMQRLAQVCGLASVGSGQLNAHPVFGPWIALRALITIDIDGPAEPPPSRPHPCDCKHHCEPRLRAAIAAAVGADNPLSNAVQADWEVWLAVRDACPIGRAYRYSHAQVRYHYTKDRRYLPDRNIAQPNPSAD